MNTLCASELREALAGLLSEPFQIACVRPHVRGSSCPLFEISITDASGARRQWLLKDASRRPRDAGPAFLYDRRRELSAYRALAHSDLPLPCFVGAHVDARRGRVWLFIERVDGVPLWQSGSLGDWLAAGEWLAGLHELRPPLSPRRAVAYDERYYARWMERARMFARDARLAALQAAHAAAVARLSREPAVTLHGDYHPSNVLVRADPETGVCPLDFELIGHGAAVLDLAALTTGLSTDVASAVVGAYRACLSDPPAIEELDELLACARLHLAIRWLGWMPRRRPPVHERFDWASEAHAAAQVLSRRIAMEVAS